MPDLVIELTHDEEGGWMYLISASAIAPQYDKVAKMVHRLALKMDAEGITPADLIALPPDADEVPF